MTWTTPVNLATGDKVTDAIWNLQVIDNLLHLYAKNYVFIQDQKASGTAGGGFTSGAWRTRDLTTEIVDTDNICVLAANQMALPIGTYRTNWACLANNVGLHQTRLQNITAGTTLVLGINARPNNGTNVATASNGIGYFTLAVASILELQHRCSVTQNVDGFGVAISWGTEIYSQIELWKLS